MAELALKIGDSSGYEDGDIVEAFNRRRIRCVHAEHICHVKDAGTTNGGLRSDGLAREFREACCQYRFERVSKREVQRVEIRTGDVQRFSSLDWVAEGVLVPHGVDFDSLPRRFNEKLGRYERLYCSCENDAGEYIDVEEYLAHQLRHPQHAIFGAPGREVWYGGRTDTSNGRLDIVWRAIEAQSEHREADYTLWPIGREEAKHCLFISVDDFGEDERRRMTASEYNGEGRDRRVIRRRILHVDWRNLPGLSAELKIDIADRSTPVDVRNEHQFDRSIVVNEKAISRETADSDLLEPVAV